MSNVRDLGHKITSLHNMQKIMRAMNMISSIKLRKHYASAASFALFSASADRIRDGIVSALRDSPTPIVRGYRSVHRAHVIMFTADRGLCGTHNSSVQKAVDGLVAESEREGVQIELTCVGNKGAGYCKRKEYNVVVQRESNEKTFSNRVLRNIASRIVSRYVKNEIQKVYVVSNVFHSTLNHETSTLQLLPFPGLDSEEGKKMSGGAVTEPGGDEFALPAAQMYLFYKLLALLKSSYLSEYSARMTAMENATNNSEDLIDKYTAMQNHARQASITNELIEIVSGKEALKG